MKACGRDNIDGRLLGFAIAGEDRLFYRADADWRADNSKDSDHRPQYDRSILVLAKSDSA